jgi:hypothetical protein
MTLVQYDISSRLHKYEPLILTSQQCSKIAFLFIKTNILLKLKIDLGKIKNCDTYTMVSSITYDDFKNTLLHSIPMSD